MAVATAPRKNSKYWSAGTLSWPQLVAWVKDPADEKECGNYLLGTLKGKERRKDTVESRSALALDADYAEPEILETLAEQEWLSLAHTTYNSTEDNPRWRVIIPLKREVTPLEYTELARKVMHLLGEHQFDRTCAEPSRFMYKPAAADFADYDYYLSDSEEVLDPDEFFSGPVMDWNAPKPSHNKRDPFEVEGAVGAFNRLYDFPATIKKFDLPYEPADEGRWHLVGARSVAGLSEVAPGLVYSHHAKDPAYGKTLSAYDLARVHLFGDLDDNAAPNTPFNRLPSHKAMLEQAGKDPQIQRELAAQIFKDSGLETEDTGWRSQLVISPRTGKMQDSIENWDLVVTHDPSFAGLYFNELTMSVETDADLPWRTLDHGGASFTGTDRAALNLHLERTYRLRPARSLIDELIDTHAMKRRRSPVKEWLETLEWDGTPRLEECLPGVEPTEYTRMVARKSLVAAVARAMEPGIKWDHMLVLYGSEGLGKSWWVEKMSRGYTAVLGRIGDKDTLLVMHRSWIMMADEGYSIRKADADAMKEFLTRTVDVYRMPFDRETLPHPRKFVFWGSTNDAVFLRRQEGNRRFLIVHCENKVDFDLLTDEYIDQVWAEALHYYRNGERLFLDDEESALAAAEREAYTEESATEGLIHQYLNTLVPSGWWEMSPEYRRMWLANRSENHEDAGTLEITQVCTLQIWVEVLGKNLGDHKRVDLLEINQILRDLPGWAAAPGRRTVPGYGTQTVFEKITK